MSISVRQLATWVGLFGLMTVGLMLIGRQTIGQIFALVQLGAFVGAPLAWFLHPQLRSRAVVVVLGLALSIALSSLAVQSLIWFDLAIPELIVLAATMYGIVLAWLLSSEEQRLGDETPEPALS
ncbi:MAG: hypothetical protein OEZ14_05470 [Acidimicrobiia bacterium]|nr:hypothetical protein [Acidimicrobiia bacterium]MDH5519966.1 hypothetical protein [Acidimicrobiia bacterium]